MKNNIAIYEQKIQNRIFTICGMQVMIDRDLAELYSVETKVLNQAVKRNIKRFPKSFRFQLTKDELEYLRSQIVTFKENLNTKYLPFVFTEQGVSMLSAVLKSDTAIEVSIRIIETFVNMRRFLSSNSLIYERFERIEQRLSKHDENFDKIFKALEDKSIKPTHGVFYDGQIFDAYEFVSKLVRSAKKSIKLIDNYVDDSVLTLLGKNQNIQITIYTNKISKQFKLDCEKYNAQYKPIKVEQFNLSHDRFLIFDTKEIYHIGASLKDLGKKWFGFSKMDIDSFEMIARLK